MRWSIVFAFFPTAVLDDGGILHVAWYDSGRSPGVVVYTHSRGTAPFADGFVDETVVDPDAVPGGFQPSVDEPTRRLREYIGMAADGGTIFLAWTHAPAAPSRIRVIALP